MAPIDALYTELKDTQAAWTELYDLLKRGQYDTATPRAATENVSVDVIHQRALTTFQLMESLRPASDEDVSALMLSARATEIRNLLTIFRTHAQSSVNAARPNLRESTVIRDANNNFSWQFFDDQTNTANIDLAGNFTQINTSLANSAC